MFSEECVKNSVYGGGGVCMAGGIRGGGMCMVGGMHGRGVWMVGGYGWCGACMVWGMHGRGHARWGACMAGDTATAADGTFSTGMHSCQRTF